MKKIGVAAVGFGNTCQYAVKASQEAKDTELKNSSSSEDGVAEGAGVDPITLRRRRSVDYHQDQFQSRVVSY